jgi:hypothetical protein
VGLFSLILFLEKQSAVSFVTIVLCIAASLYMHNMTIFYLLGMHAVWLTYPSTRSVTQRMRELLLADTVAGILYLPWVPSLMSQANVDIVQKYFWAPRPTIWTILGTLRFIAGLNTRYLGWLSARLLPLSLTTACQLVAVVVGGVCAALVAGGLFRVPKVERNKNISLMLYCLLPILAVFVLSRITTPLFIDRIFINSSVVVPIVLAYPVALQKGLKWEKLYNFLGIMLAAVVAFSGFGYLRYQQKDDWRGAIASVLRIPERNRLVVFIPRMGELLFDYYAQKSPIVAPGLAKLALPVSYLGDFPPPRGGKIQATHLNQLKLAVESGKYSEADLILSNERHDDPSETAFDYLGRVFMSREEQQFSGSSGVRVVRFTTQ